MRSIGNLNQDPNFIFIGASGFDHVLKRNVINSILEKIQNVNKVIFVISGNALFPGIIENKIHYHEREGPQFTDIVANLIEMSQIISIKNANAKFFSMFPLPRRYRHTTNCDSCLIFNEKGKTIENRFRNFYLRRKRIGHELPTLISHFEQYSNFLGIRRCFIKDYHQRMFEDLVLGSQDEIHPTKIGLDKYRQYLIHVANKLLI